MLNVEEWVFIDLSIKDELFIPNWERHLRQATRRRAKKFALVERYRTDYFYECYEYENAKVNKSYEWSDLCFTNQEELLEFFSYKIMEDLETDPAYARRVETFTDEYEKKLMKLCDAGNQIKVMGAN